MCYSKLALTRRDYLPEIMGPNHQAVVNLLNSLLSKGSVTYSDAHLRRLMRAQTKRQTLYLHVICTGYAWKAFNSRLHRGVPFLNSSSNMVSYDSARMTGMILQSQW